MMFDSFEAYDVQETRRISRAEGNAEFLIKVLEKNGYVPKELHERIMAETESEVLNRWFEAAMETVSIEEFQKNIN